MHIFKLTRVFYSFTCLHAAVQHAANFEEATLLNHLDPSRPPHPPQVLLLLIQRHAATLYGPASAAGETVLQLALRLHGVRATAFLEYLHSRHESSSSSSSSSVSSSTAAAAAAAPVSSPITTTSAGGGVAASFVFEMCDCVEWRLHGNYCTQTTQTYTHLPNHTP